MSREAVPQIAGHPDPMPCTFGMLHSGNWPAAAPDEAVLKGVFGFLPPFHREDIQAKLGRGRRTLPGGDPVPHAPERPVLDPRGAIP